MKTISIEIPITSIKEGEKAILEQIAIQLYEQKIFSFGQVRRLLNISVWELQKLLGDNQVERHYSEEDLAEDIQSIRAGDWQ